MYVGQSSHAFMYIVQGFIPISSMYIWVSFLSSIVFFLFNCLVQTFSQINVLTISPHGGHCFHSVIFSSYVIGWVLIWLFYFCRRKQWSPMEQWFALSSLFSSCHQVNKYEGQSHVVKCISMRGKAQLTHHQQMNKYEGQSPIDASSSYK